MRASTLATRYIAYVSRELLKRCATLPINYASSSILWATATYVCTFRTVQSRYYTSVYALVCTQTDVGKYYVAIPLGD